MNPLRVLPSYGQSIWLDYIRRWLITNGELRRLAEEDGLRGVTSNPAIFEKAIAGSGDYEEALKGLEQQGDMDAKRLYEHLAIEDIQMAADVLAPVYRETRRRDGYVSLEVSPYLARDTEATAQEVRRLWQAVGRPNVMIKVPATAAGIPAIRQLIGEGINVNVTLLFDTAVYEKVADAYLSGLETILAQGGDPGGIASVASFFVSRIDTAVDTQLEARLRTETDRAERARLQSLVGKVAIANARMAYQRYRKLYGSPRWQALAAQGAQTQRLLWASTGTKNPSYSDVLYVEELIGPDTVNTVPAPTLEAFRDHGRPRASLEEDLEDAHDTLEGLERVGTSLENITGQLLEDGVRLFADAFDKLLGAVEGKRQALLGPRINRQSYRLPPDLAAALEASLEDWRVNGKVRRLWARDASLWTGSDEGGWLGWLGLTEDQRCDLGRFGALADEVKAAGFTHAVVLGMGGSSLCPDVMRRTFGKTAGFPELHVLDSTDPAQIRALEQAIDLPKTLFIVSSKSGGTLEPNIFKDYFFDRVNAEIGAAEAPHRFIAITDPGTKLHQMAEHQGFRRIFCGVPSIGGRYSALSNFGMVPAAIMGVDVAKFLEKAEEMVHGCGACVPPKDNPGVVLGTILGVAANRGQNKVTFIASPSIQGFGAWLEQLLAESTGKDGKGLIPVDQEPLGPPEVYGQDRLFVYLRLDSDLDPAQEAAVVALEEAGQPVVRISIADPCELGEEFLRWEIATAVAGSLLGINPFNQPDVEASKLAARRLTSEYEKTRSLPPEVPILEAQGIRLFADEKNAADLAEAAAAMRSLETHLKAHLGRLMAGDYFGLLAYVAMNPSHHAILQDLRRRVRDAKRVATCLGYGPRYLHSTGQAYKGGPDSGVFLLITCDDAFDLPVPGHNYTFGVVKAAQARGDLEVLGERGRRVLRVHLGEDVAGGLNILQTLMQKALS